MCVWSLFFLALSFKNCSKFAFKQLLSHSRTRSHNKQVRKLPFVYVCFLMKMCSMMVFITIWFILFSSFHFSLFLARTLSFHKDSYKKLLFDCVCVCGCVLLFYICVFWVWFAVFLSLLQYQIANMVQISQMHLICFLLLLKYIMIFLFSFFVAALYNLAYQVLY